MIEITLAQYLKKKMNPIPVYLEYPDKNLTEFVVLEKTGSGELNYIKEAQFAIQSISTSKLDAAKLNYAIIDAMKDMTDEVDCICEAVKNSDYDFTDSTTKQYRYQAIYDIKYC